MFGWRMWKRARARRRPFTPTQRRVLDLRVAWYRRLPAEARSELDDLVKIFLAEKRFEGCAELAVTEEMRIVIAAQACMLVLGRNTDVYPHLHTILIYPEAFVATVTESDGFVVREHESVRLGEAWHDGTVVLAWDQTAHDAADVRDGQNVVFHEFAHALDYEDGVADGAPILPARSRYVAWARTFGEAYDDLRARLHRRRPSVLDPYAATDPAEFFAVATECFFERGGELERAYPELYGELRAFYRRDPAALARGEPERIDGAHDRAEVSPPYAATAAGADAASPRERGRSGAEEEST